MSRLIGILILALGLTFIVEPAIYWTTLGQRPSSIGLALIGTLTFAFTYARLTWDVVRHQPAGNRLPGDLVACGATALALPLIMGRLWLGMPALFMGIAVLNLAPRRAKVVVPAVLGVTVAISILLGLNALDVMDLIIRCAITATVIFSAGWLGALYREVHQTRAELARMAVVEERHRFARDLHDVLGHSLSVIAMRSELALRLIESRPQRASAEMQGVLAISRQSITDVREVVRGYHNLNLANELAGVQSVLNAASVACEVDEVPPNLSQPIHEALAWVVREATTNILRHSKATYCTIKLWVTDQDVFLCMSNDGVTMGALSAGNGLTGLTKRLADLGGCLVFGISSGPIYKIEAVVPLDPATGATR
ncbi:histidine kinase [Nonomuraea sp. NPDC000554]|uniref:sensor histidine kinase n=1 Tax=Nonomuraea sp. NPDC000554 TaxID=3154259 RepID=UPI003322D6D9